MVKADEVSGIEGENASHAVYVRDSRQPGIVDLRSHNAVLNDKTLPFGIDRGGVGQQRQEVFDYGHLGKDDIARKSQAVLIRGARRNIPEFSDVLWREINRSIPCQ